MLHRRDLLKWAASGLGAGLAPAAAADNAPAAPQGSQTPAPSFDFAAVVARARALAERPHEAPSSALPGPLSNLSYEQYVSIRPKAGTALWGGDNVGFAIEPLHRGFLFAAPMAINVVEGGVARRLAYAASAFDFGKVSPPGEVGDIGFSGFRVLHARAGRGLADAAIFQGASFFRCIANGQNFGVTARALMIRTADPKGEEFPAIREVWIEKPSLANDLLVINALVDSDSMCGAFRFTLRPGEVTIVDTECTLFARSPADFYGLGGMTGMYLFGPAGRHGADDVRLGAYDISGLQILNGNGEWLWRPVTDPSTLQVSVFMDGSPRGFGLLQRERDFDQLQDDDQRWELRPSLWIEPINDWGEGSVELVEIPTDSENNDNIICFWRPKAVLEPKSEASFSYRQFWCWTPPDRPPFATVADTRVGRLGGHRRRFVVEFAGDAFADPQAARDVKPALTASAGTVGAVRTFPSAERKTLRVLFDVDFGGDALSELRLVLENGGKPVSETWLYRWTA